jgi:hypothetical protein
VFNRSFATVMVWFATAICGVSIFATEIPHEGYFSAFGWCVVMAGATFLIGRLGVWLFWGREDYESRRGGSRTEQ